MFNCILADFNRILFSGSEYTSTPIGHQQRIIVVWQLDGRYHRPPIRFLIFCLQIISQFPRKVVLNLNPDIKITVGAPD
jgi:hypothetical protein